MRPASLDEWFQMIDRRGRWNRPARQLSYWRRRARLELRSFVYDNVEGRRSFDDLPFDQRDELLQKVDEYRPFTQELEGVEPPIPGSPIEKRAMKAWRAECEVLRAALDMLPPPTADDHAACEVAMDLVELDRIDEAKELLEREAPRRHNRVCPACGARPLFACRHPVTVEVTTAERIRGIQSRMVQTERATTRVIHKNKTVDLVVPHLARVIPRPPSRTPKQLDLLGGQP